MPLSDLTAAFDALTIPKARYEAERWITIGAHKGDDGKGSGGTPVKLDGRGRIVSGPGDLQGKTLNKLKQEATPKTQVQHAAKAAAKLHGLRRKHIEDAIDQVYETKRQEIDQREKARERARKITGLHAGDIARLENQYKDNSSLDWLDTAATEFASNHPEMGISDPQGLWDFIRQGKETVPAKHSEEVVSEAVEIVRQNRSSLKHRIVDAFDDAFDGDDSFDPDRFALAEAFGREFYAQRSLFREEDHPRDSDGTFTKGAGSDKPSGEIADEPFSLKPQSANKTVSKDKGGQQGSLFGPKPKTTVSPADALVPKQVEPLPGQRTLEESNDERSRREWAENWQSVMADPDKASDKDLRRAFGFGDNMHAKYLRDGNKELADGVKVELDNIKRILREREQAAAPKPKAPIPLSNQKEMTAAFQSAAAEYQSPQHKKNLDIVAKLNNPQARKLTPGQAKAKESKRLHETLAAMSPDQINAFAAKHGVDPKLYSSRHNLQTAILFNPVAKAELLPGNLLTVEPARHSLAEVLERAFYAAWDESKISRDRLGQFAAADSGASSGGKPKPIHAPTVYQLLTKPPVKIASISRTFRGSATAAKDWARKNLADKSFENLDTGVKIRISRSKIDKGASGKAYATSNTPDHFEAFQALPDLLKHAVLGYSELPEDPSSGLRRVHRFYAPLEVGGDVYRVKLTVKEFVSEKEGTGYYTHELTEIEMPASKIGVRQASTNKTMPLLAGTLSISDLLAGANRKDGTSILPTNSVKYSLVDQFNRAFYSRDASGHEHKPAGPGGGQFTSSGSGGTGKADAQPSIGTRVADRTDFTIPASARAKGFTHAFTTSGGSQYLVKNGGTSRFKKSPGMGEGKIDAHSSATHYIDPEKARRIVELLRDYSTNPTHKAAIRSVPGGLGLVVKDRRTGKVDDSRSRVITGEKSPRVGLAPVEVWDKNAAGEYGFHVGHDITDLKDLAPAKKPHPLTAHFDAEFAKQLKLYALSIDAELDKVLYSRAAGEPHEFSCALINLDDCLYTRTQGPVADKVRKLAASIPDADLAADGRETEPHVTVKFGLHADDASNLTRVVRGFGPIRFKLGKTSLFQNPQHDVLKVDVDSSDLHRLNKLISDKLPHTDTHPDYKPHVTIAYVKPGMGRKYAGVASLEGCELSANRIVFSDKFRKHVEIPLVDVVRNSPLSALTEAFNRQFAKA